MGILRLDVLSTFNNITYVITYDLVNYILFSVSSVNGVFFFSWNAAKKMFLNNSYAYEGSKMQ